MMVNDFLTSISPELMLMGTPLVFAANTIVSPEAALATAFLKLPAPISWTLVTVILAA